MPRYESNEMLSPLLQTDPHVYLICLFVYRLGLPGTFPGAGDGNLFC
jgi:hypothetical protein